MIRPATPADIPTLLAMGRRFHAASGMPAPFDADATGAVLARLIGGGGVVLLTDRGCIGGILAPLWFAPAWRMAVEMFWWAEGDGLALLRAFEAWARAEGAQEVRMTTLHALPRADAIMRRRGYAPVEISYTKVL